MRAVDRIDHPADGGVETPTESVLFTENGVVGEAAANRLGQCVLDLEVRARDERAIRLRAHIDVRRAVVAHRDEVGSIGQFKRELEEIERRELSHE